MVASYELPCGVGWRELVAEETHVESCWHHHHAGARVTAVPVAWSAAVILEHADRGGARPNGDEACHTTPRASQEGNPDAHAVISGAAQSASRLLANPDANPHADPHGGANPNPNPNAHAGSDAHARPHRQPHGQSRQPRDRTGRFPSTQAVRPV